MDIAKESAKADSSTVGTPEVKDVKPKKPAGFSNPALKAMGINSIRLPSRNWMIFWCVVATGVGGYAYDKYEQKRLRKKWMDRVAKYGAEPLSPDLTARKVTVYVAPPPSDYLDESLAVFRRYVKPILNAGGVDFQIQSENRQGVIRSTVAAEIRSLRREVLNNTERLEREKEAKKWYNRLKRFLSRSNDESVNLEAVEDKISQDKYTLTNLLGVYYKNALDEGKLHNEDAFVSDPTANGGVICIGRGAYKEYLHGLHEGLLGPLEKPIDSVDIDVPVEGTKDKDSTPESESSDTLEGAEVAVVAGEQLQSEDIDQKEHKDANGETNDMTNEESNDENSEEGEKLAKVPRPFIDPLEYSKTALAPELSFEGKIQTDSKVSPVFQQPIAVIPVYHLIGFLQTPVRIWRFYHKRELTDEYGRLTCAVVENLRRKFTPEDVDWAKDEEKDWPSKWVQKGIDKGSEWIQDTVVDDRVLNILSVYDASSIKDEKE